MAKLRREQRERKEEREQQEAKLMNDKKNRDKEITRALGRLPSLAEQEGLQLDGDSCTIEYFEANDAHATKLLTWSNLRGDAKKKAALVELLRTVGLLTDVETTLAPSHNEKTPVPAAAKAASPLSLSPEQQQFSPGAPAPGLAPSASSSPEKQQFSPRAPSVPNLASSPEQQQFSHPAAKTAPSDEQFSPPAAKTAADDIGKTHVPAALKQQQFSSLDTTDWSDEDFDNMLALYATQNKKQEDDEKRRLMLLDMALKESSKREEESHKREKESKWREEEITKERKALEVEREHRRERDIVVSTLTAKRLTAAAKKKKETHKKTTPELQQEDPPQESQPALKSVPKAAVESVPKAAVASSTSKHVHFAPNVQIHFFESDQEKTTITYTSLVDLKSLWDSKDDGKFECDFSVEAVHNLKDKFAVRQVLFIARKRELLKSLSQCAPAALAAAYEKGYGKTLSHEAKSDGKKLYKMVQDKLINEITMYQKKLK